MQKELEAKKQRKELAQKKYVSLIYCIYPYKSKAHVNVWT